MNPHETDYSQDTLSDVIPEDRIGAPLPRKGRRSIFRLCVGALLGGAAYTITAYNPEWATALIDKARIAAAAVREAQRQPAETQTTEALSPPVPEALHETPLRDTSRQVPSQTEQSAENTAPVSKADLPVHVVEEAPPVAAVSYTDASQPIAVPSEHAAARDRAKKAGLGDDLPNILLARLSKADLENASYAIKTALQKTPEHAQLSWPPKPSAHEALFEVRFVESATEGCRRYVVTVTKERWSSTSGAVEACRNAAGASP